MERFEDIRATRSTTSRARSRWRSPTRSPPTSRRATCSSSPRAHGPHQKWACVVLKVMHIIHHINGRQALLKVSVSDEIIFREIELKVLQVVEQLRAAGAPLAEFEWSRKPRDSQITKLLAKRSTLAASIYDKLRFRLIVPNARGPRADARDADAPADPVQLRRARRVGEPARRPQTLIARPPSASSDAPAAPRSPFNEFSGPEYRIINFVADLPLRLERLLPRAEIPHELSHVVFVLTEFQVCDKATAHAQRVRRVEPRGLQGAPARARAHAPVPRQGRSSAGRLARSHA